MAGGKIYLEPILEDIVNKINDILDVIDTKVTSQIQALENVATIVGASADPTNVEITHLLDSSKNYYESSEFSLTLDSSKNTDSPKSVTTNLFRIDSYLDGTINLKIKDFIVKSQSFNSNDYPRQTKVKINVKDNGSTDVALTGTSEITVTATHAQTVTENFEGDFYFTVAKGHYYAVSVTSSTLAVYTKGEVQYIPSNDNAIEFGYINTLDPNQGILVTPANNGGVE